MTALLAIRGATKRFGAVTALDGVDLDVQAGEVLALLGDNGAGKSTLIKCISGAHRLDDGSIEMDGDPVAIHSPADARLLGIETVYQDLALFDNLTPSDNFYAGRELAGPSWLPQSLRSVTPRPIRKGGTMSKMRLIPVAAVLVAAMLIAVLAGGAKATPSAPQTSGSVVKLGFITKFPVGFFFTLQNAAKKWDKQHPGAAVIFAQGKSATDDAGEIAAIQDMVAKGVKGIAITPTSPAVAAALDKAIKQGVRVVLMDNDIPTWKNKASVVATDNYKGGVLAGKYLAAHLKAGDKVGVLAGVPGVPSLDDRVNGMLAGLGSLKSQLKIVGKLETDCAQDKGFAAAQTILTANPDLKAMYSACGPPALGALQAIKGAGIDPKDIWTVGYDAQPEEVAEIVKGNEEASVAQFPHRIGLLGIDTLWKVVNGKKVAKKVDTGTALVTNENRSSSAGKEPTE